MESKMSHRFVSMLEHYCASCLNLCFQEFYNVFGSARSQMSYIQSSLHSVGDCMCQWEARFFPVILLIHTAFFLLCYPEHFVCIHWRCQMPYTKSLPTLRYTLDFYKK